MLRLCRLIPEHTRSDDRGRGFGATDLWLLSVAAVWGGNAVAIKLALRAVSPLGLLGMRMVGVAILLTAATILRAGRRQWLDLFSDRFIWFGGAILAAQAASFFYAYQMTTASEAALLISTTPLWTALMVASCGLERLCGRNWIGLGVAVVGVAGVLFGGGGQVAADAPARLPGDALMILSAILFALYQVVMKGVMERVGTVRVLGTSYLIAGVAFLPLVVPEGAGVYWGGISILSWSMIAYVVFMAGGYAFFTWYRAVKNASVQRVSVYQYLVPVLAATAAWVFLDEHLAVLQLVGIAVTLIGVYMGTTGLRESCIRQSGGDG